MTPSGQSPLSTHVPHRLRREPWLLWIAMVLYVILAASMLLRTKADVRQMGYLSALGALTLLAGTALCHVGRAQPAHVCGAAAIVQLTIMAGMIVLRLGDPRIVLPINLVVALAFAVMALMYGEGLGALIRSCLKDHPLLTTTLLLCEGAFLAVFVISVSHLTKVVVEYGDHFAIRTVSVSVGLMFWAIAIYFHAAAFACWRGARGGRPGFLAFLGMLFLMLWITLIIGYNNSSVMNIAAPKSAEAVLWLAPSVSWVFLTIGVFLLILGLGRPSPDHRSVLATSSQLPTAAIESGLNISLFTILMLLSIVLSSIITAYVLFMYISSVILRLNLGEQLLGASFCEATVMMCLYLLPSVLVQIVGLIEGRKAHADHDADRLWRAGLLATVGGLHHVLLVGIPAIYAGICAVRTASLASAFSTIPPAGTASEAESQKACPE